MRKEGTWTQILTALSQIRRLKGNPGSDYNVTEIPKYFKMDQRSISLLETTVCKLIFPPFKVRMSNHLKSEFKNEVDSDHSES